MIWGGQKTSWSLLAAMGCVISMLAGCQRATVRRVDTAQGKSLEVRCSTESMCQQRVNTISCRWGTKRVERVSPRLLRVTCPLTQERGSASAAARVPKAPAESSIALPRELSARAGPIAPTSTMFGAARRVAEVERRGVGELESIRVEVAASCQAGNLDDCLVEVELSPWSVLPRWGDTPARNFRNIEKRTRRLLELCKSRHAPSCYHLGDLVYMTHQGDTIFSLSDEGGLPDTLADALKAHPGYRTRSDELVRRIVRMLRSQQEPNDREMRGWSLECRRGGGAACLLGATFNWNFSIEKDQDVYRRVAEPALQMARKPLITALMRHCSDKPSVCAVAVHRQWEAGLIGRDDQCARFAELCDSGDGDACYRFAGCHDEAAEPVWHERACSLGDAKGCGALVERSLDAGTPMVALAYALQACQENNLAGCSVLVEKFGRSRDYTDEHTGMLLTRHACSTGDQDACQDVYLAEYRLGHVDEARRHFGQLCVQQENVRACRYAAQIDWIGNRRDSATTLLRRGCTGDHDDINSCIELASAMAYQGRVEQAKLTLARQCQRQKGSVVSQSCRLLRRIEAGTLPRRLSDVFMLPLDGSEYSFDPKP